MPEIIQIVPEQIYFTIRLSLEEVQALNIGLDRASIDLCADKEDELKLIEHIEKFHEFTKALLGEANGS